MHISLIWSPDFTKFTVALFSSGGIVILPVLWMKSCIPITGPYGGVKLLQQPSPCFVVLVAGTKRCRTEYAVHQFLVILPQKGCELLWGVCLFVCLLVCLSVCLRISKTAQPNFTKFLCILPRLWLDPHMTVLQNIMYFRFCEWRHVLIPWASGPESSMTLYLGELVSKTIPDHF